jgi:hypothetical protein
LPSLRTPLVRPLSLSVRAGLMMTVKRAVLMPYRQRLTPRSVADAGKSVATTVE